MNGKDRLKTALLEAEKNKYASLPEDDLIDWTPSAEFEAKIKCVLTNNTKTRRNRIKIRLAVVAAALVVISSACIVMLSNGEDSATSGSLTSDVSDTDVNTNMDIPFMPDYIPAGYMLNSCKIWSDGSLEIEYINGENQLYFRSYPAEEVDLSVFEEVLHTENMSGLEIFQANNYNGVANNNVAWNNGNYSFVITNTDGIPLEEMIRIALSVNAQPYETEE